MRYLLATGALSLSSLVTLPVSAATTDSCHAFFPIEEAPQKGPVTADVLVSLRDIGPVYKSNAARNILSLAPDGRSVAFELRQADPETNRYCAGMIILPLEKDGAPYLVDRTDEMILDRSPAFGWAAFETGIPVPNTPRWTPDGRSVAYLKRSGGSTNVWAFDLATRRARQATHVDADVEDFRVTSDGRSIVYSTRAAVADQQRAIDREGQRGWRFDTRALPIRGPRPQTPAAALTFSVVDLDSAVERRASPEEIALLSPPPNVPAQAPAFSTGLTHTAWLKPVDGSLYPADHDLVIDGTGHQQVCPASVCAPNEWTPLWWTQDEQRLRFIRREGWGGSLTAIYEWAPGMSAARRLFVTSDLLAECQPVGNDLICLRERAREPRKLVTLDLTTGRERILFDANPAFSSFSMGKVERLNWRNGTGVPFYGDLVYPVRYSSGTRFPLVVVQYRTRGFLRGGVGDEVPIQALANKGYFVLVIDIRDAEAIVGRQNSAMELQAAYDRDLVGQKNILSAIETAAQLLIDRGMVDAKRIGITGLSAGSITVQYAAIKSSFFAAGSVSGCCLEPTQDVFLGPMIAAMYHEAGWPALLGSDAAIWRDISLMTQPERVKFPVLFQAADNEYLAALGSYTAIRQQEIPADLYIFPDEFHLKRHPAHQRAVYNRNISWFDFWLRGELPESPEDRVEAQRWADMREKWRASTENRYLSE